MLDIPDDKWALTFNINVTGSYFVGDEAFKKWKEQGLKGQLMLMTSANPVVAKKRFRCLTFQRGWAIISCVNWRLNLRRWCVLNGVAPATVVQGSAMFPRARFIGSLVKYNMPYKDDEATESLVKKLAQFYADCTLTKAPITPAD